MAIEKQAPGIIKKLINSRANPKYIPIWLGQGKDKSHYNV
jgi:hypothetical protein